MKVRVLRSVQLTPSLVGYEGQTLELEEGWARRWIARGYVVPVGKGPSLGASDLAVLLAARDTALRGGRVTQIGRFVDRQRQRSLNRARGKG